MSAPIIARTVHLTLTGIHAGVPYCGIPRGTEESNGHTFMHAPYSRMSAELRAKMCPNCLAHYDLARAQSALEFLEGCGLLDDDCQPEEDKAELARIRALMAELQNAEG